MIRMKDRINYMVYMAKHKTLRKSMNLPVTNYKLVFITLTLSSAQIHSDREIKQKLLQPFIRIMRNRWKCVNYVWKAEVQDNGNIHFHVLTHQYIYWREIRDTWNTLQESLGYITRAKSADPNSTDVHAVYKKRNPAGYMSKELCKADWYQQNEVFEKWDEHYYQDQLYIQACDIKSKKEVILKRGVEGKIYDCNTELKSIIARVEYNPHLADDLAKAGANKFPVIKGDYFTVFTHPLPSREYSELKSTLDYFILQAYIKN